MVRTSLTTGSHGHGCGVGLKPPSDDRVLQGLIVRGRGGAVGAGRGLASAWADVPRARVRVRGAEIGRKARGEGVSR